MIHGEEYWLEQLDQNEEYDLFFKKIRKKIKKIKPLKIFNPIKTIGSGLVGGIVKPLIKKKRPAPPTVNTSAIVAQATEAKEVELANDRETLMNEMVEFEKKKVKDIEKINEKEIATEQASIDAEHGENKKMLMIGLIGLGSLALVGGVFVWIKSRQNQLAALNIQDTV